MAEEVFVSFEDNTCMGTLCRGLAPLLLMLCRLVMLIRLLFLFVYHLCRGLVRRLPRPPRCMLRLTCHHTQLTGRRDSADSARGSHHFSLE